MPKEIPREILDDAIHTLVHHSIEKESNFICEFEHGDETYEITVTLKKGK